MGLLLDTPSGSAQAQKHYVRSFARSHLESKLVSKGNIGSGWKKRGLWISETASQPRPKGHRGGIFGTSGSESQFNFQLFTLLFPRMVGTSRHSFRRAFISTCFWPDPGPWARHLSRRVTTSEPQKWLRPRLSLFHGRLLTFALSHTWLNL